MQGSEEKGGYKSERMVDALVEVGDEGRRWLRKASGSCQANCDPGMSEWGNPPMFTSVSLSEFIG